MSSSKNLSLVSGKKKKNKQSPVTPNPAYNQNAPYVVSSSVSDKNVRETRRLKNQLTEVVKELHNDRAHEGYNSALIAQGIGPIPGAKLTKYKQRPIKLITEYADGHQLLLHTQLPAVPFEQELPEMA